MADMKAHDMAPVACEAIVASALKSFVSIIPHVATVGQQSFLLYAGRQHRN